MLRSSIKLRRRWPAPAPGRPLRDSRKNEIDAFKRAGALPRSASRRLAIAPTRTPAAITPAGTPTATITPDTAIATAPANILRHLLGGRRDVDCSAAHGGGARGGHAEDPHADGREQQKNVWFHANGLVTERSVRQIKRGAIRSSRTSKEEPHQVLKSRGDIELRFPEMVVVRNGSNSGQNRQDSRRARLLLASKALKLVEGSQWHFPGANSCISSPVLRQDRPSQTPHGRRPIRRGPCRCLCPSRPAVEPISPRALSVNGCPSSLVSNSSRSTGQAPPAT